MALNLQLTVIFKFHSGKWMKLALYIVPLLSSLLISILPLAFGQISLAEGSCWFKEWTPLGLQWAYITNYGWIMATIVYCTIVFTSVTFYLIIQRSLFRSSFQGMKSGSLEVKTRTIIKLLMYPLIPIICYALVLVKLALAGLGIKLAEETGYSLNIAATFFKGFQGFFNATLFLFNSLLYREARLAFESSISRKESQRI
ncbi:hypothetical protein K502DRAFT_323049 [Neoconidiobolus thromboides FSU 785]|nr:hypothetical protein K502DRAFT_323049 [Neoconidiobolus thromboides FSU 785]